jgi:hypothetical protein
MQGPKKRSRDTDLLGCQHSPTRKPKSVSRIRDCQPSPNHRLKLVKITSGQSKLLNKTDADKLLEDFEKYLRSEKYSPCNLKKTFESICKLVRGQGIKHRETGHVFKEQQPVTLGMDMSRLREDATAFVGIHGDKSNGWLLHHPLRKLEKFQTHLVQRMVDESKAGGMGGVRVGTNHGHSDGDGHEENGECDEEEGIRNGAEDDESWDEEFMFSQPPNIAHQQPSFSPGMFIGPGPLTHERSHIPQPDSSKSALPNRPFSSRPVAYLKVLTVDGKDTPLRFDLCVGENVIGRKRLNEVRLNFPW